MTEVVVHRPGHSAPYSYHNPDTGLDEQRTEWTFNATVNGHLGIVSGIFAPSVSEESAAYWIRQNLMLHPDELEGILSGGGGGGSFGGPAGAGGGSDGGGYRWTPNDEKMKTETGSSTTKGGAGGGGGGGGGGDIGPAGPSDGGGVSIPPPKMKTEDGT